MSAPRKPQASGGKGMPAATRLKLLPLADREVIFGWCNGEESLTDVRGKVREVYGISLSSDSQLSRFRDWQFHQARTERLNNWTEELEESYKRFDPSASMDKVREFALATLLKEAMASGDGKFALDVFDRDLAERSAKTKAVENKEKIEIARRRVVLLEKKAAQADAAKQVLGSELSVEEQNKRLREILK